jgi:hypothetical protein
MSNGDWINIQVFISTASYFYCHPSFCIVWLPVQALQNDSTVGLLVRLIMVLGCSS